MHRLKMMPGSMNNKKLLKVVFGNLVKMPKRLKKILQVTEPVKISQDTKDTSHKVIYIVGTCSVQHW